MEEKLAAIVKEMAAKDGVKGVLIVDKYGLPIESVGSMTQTQSGLISSIMKNVSNIS